MSNWADGLGTGRAMCGACAGRRFVVAANAIELCPICGGVGRIADVGDGLGASVEEPLRPWRIAAVTLFLAVVGWPSLRFIDFALQAFLARVI